MIMPTLVAAAVDAVPVHVLFLTLAVTVKVTPSDTTLSPEAVYMNEVSLVVFVPLLVNKPDSFQVTTYSSGTPSKLGGRFHVKRTCPSLSKPVPKIDLLSSQVITPNEPMLTVEKDAEA